MKILLIGEFSGVHNNLKKGLLALGHDVKLAADGDGYRGFSYDFRIAPHKGNTVGKIKNILYLFSNIRKFTGYDIVQFISPFSIPYYYTYVGLLSIIFKFNKLTGYYACGTDPAFLTAKNKFDYFPFDEDNKDELPNYHLVSLLHYRYFIRRINCIIPSMYSYAVGYYTNSKLTLPIPLPGTGGYTEKIKPICKKINILFGITRPGFKGATHILKALDRLRIEHADLVEITIVNKLPFAEYLKYLEDTDILIDQCKSYDYGMNAILAMEKGVVVMSGAEVIAMEYLMSTNNPIINIKPDAKLIYNQIIKLITERKIDDQKLKSILYVDEMHSLEKVSKRFENHYKTIYF